MLRSAAARGVAPKLARAFSNIHQGINKTGMDKAVLIKGGTIVNSDREFKGDILSIGETIAQVSETPIEKPTGLDVEVIDANGCYVMPGGIDPQTHMEIPFMGTRGIDDFYSGLAAAQTGGTTMLMDFVIPGKGQRLMEAWESWNEWASKAAGDYSFHVAVTWWDDSVKEDQKTLSELGVNSFKHFLAYKGAIMADDEILVNSFSNCAELGCMATIHAENGEIISHLQQQIFDSVRISLRAPSPTHFFPPRARACSTAAHPTWRLMHPDRPSQGITGPEGHPASRPPEVEGEATNRAIRIAEMIGIPVYIVHTSSRDAMDAVAAARARGQVAFSEVLSQHLVVDESMYYHEDWRVAAHHVMSPPFRNKKHQESLWNALTAGIAQTTATDHCSFSTKQKEAGKNDFRIIPNGTGGLEDRLSILWHHGVNTGKLTRTQFVDVTSANAAKIFNIYPRKGAIQAGADADVIVWDPEATRTISADTHYQKSAHAHAHAPVSLRHVLWLLGSASVARACPAGCIIPAPTLLSLSLARVGTADYNIFEGMEVKGVNKYTTLRGRVTYSDGTLREDGLRGYGKFIPRPTHSRYFEQARLQHAQRQITAVKRAL